MAIAFTFNFDSIEILFGVIWEELIKFDIREEFDFHVFSIKNGTILVDI